MSKPRRIQFTLPAAIFSKIEIRDDCPSHGLDQLDRGSTWVLNLVLKELGVEASPSTVASEAAQATRQQAALVKAYLRACTGLWKLESELAALEDEPSESRSRIQRQRRLQDQLATIEAKLHEYPRADGHQIACDCLDCQTVVANSASSQVDYSSISGAYPKWACDVEHDQFLGNEPLSKIASP